MKYLVMECGISYAVVLDQQGKFLKVANLGYDVGQLVEDVIPFKEERGKVRKGRKVISILAAAACFCLVLLGAFQFLLSPYGTVRMQINPDVMISVNRWDYVIDVEGINEDGEELTEDYHFIGKKVDQVSDELADLAADRGFLEGGDRITLTVESEHENWKTATEDMLITELTIHFDSQIEIRTYEDMDDRETEHDGGGRTSSAPDEDGGSAGDGGQGKNVSSGDDDSNGDDDGDDDDGDDSDDDDGDDSDDDDDGDDGDDGDDDGDD